MKNLLFTLMLMQFTFCVAQESITILPGQTINVNSSKLISLRHTASNGNYLLMERSFGDSYLEGFPTLNLAVNNGPAAVKLGTEIINVNYTALGFDAPFIKTKLLLGSTSSTQGGSTVIAHGVSATKILALRILIDSGANGRVVAEYTGNPNFQASMSFDGTNIFVTNNSSNSANILNKPFKIYITYEQ
jgi:hypothetical protein